MLRLFRRRPSHREWLASNPSPLHTLLKLWLNQARLFGITAFIFGMPRELTPEAAAAAVAGWRAGDAEDVERLRPAAEIGSDEATRRAMEGGGGLRCANGLEQVPCWQRVGGRLHPFTGPPAALYAAFLCNIEEQLVSLGASEADPRPRRFLEYDAPDGPPGRWFAEVELWFDEDGTVRLEILGHRQEPASVRAVPSVY